MKPPVGILILSRAVLLPGGVLSNSYAPQSFNFGNASSKAFSKSNLFELRRTVILFSPSPALCKLNFSSLFGMSPET